MAAFLKSKNVSDDSPVVFNLDHIIAINPAPDDKHTEIITTAGTVYVDEPFDDILTAIENKMRGGS